ncbi:MASE1 protein [Marivita geojedonensis]|nr:MASE1 protein [Marivita geojedonensis]
MFFVIVALAYVLCHGMTDLLIAPFQRRFLPETTVFASLIYLPHGVRVLATWAFGWKAVPGLLAGTVCSISLFSSDHEVAYLSPQIIEGVVLGSVSALLAFEFARLSGHNLYAGQERRLSWQGMIIIGALSSVINAIGQTVIYSGLIGFEDLGEVLVMYAIGDLAGVVLCMIALMFVFRWLRLRSLS